MRRFWRRAPLICRQKIRKAFGRAAPARRYSQGAGEFSEDSFSGRAYYRLGSADAGEYLGDGQKTAEGKRHDGISNHSLYGRGGCGRLCGGSGRRKIAARGTPALLKREYAADSLKLYGEVSALMGLIKDMQAEAVPLPEE